MWLDHLLSKEPHWPAGALMLGVFCLVGLLWGFCFVSHYGPRWLVMRANIFGWLGISFHFFVGVANIF